MVFTKPSGCIIQVSKDAVLALENAGILVKGCSIVQVMVGSVGPGQIPMLSDAKLPVADLFVRQSWYNDLRVRIVISRDNVVPNRRTVIERLVLADRRNGGALACWDRGVRSL